MRALGFFARALAILTVASIAAIRYALGRFGLAFVRDRDVRRRRIHALRGRVVQRALARLGATFIKLGQVMSSRPDLFEREFIAELSLLQDRLPAFAGQEARAQIEATIGAPIETRFREFDDAPVAAASVAQVHRARLRDGTEVAVKVLRPDVRAKTERDAAILQWLAQLAMRLHPAARHAELASHLARFVAGVIAQTDLRTEAANYERFRTNFRGVEGIVFPRTYPELSGERVMTMDFVHGRKIDALGPGEHGVIARRLREAFLKMMFTDGFLHADLHPGNLLITERGEVAIFDVGLCMHMTEELLVQYIDFNKCLVIGSVEDVVGHLRRFHSYVAGTVDWEQLTIDTREFIAEFRGKPASEIEFGALIDRVFEIGRRHGIRPVPDMTLVMVGLVTAEGIGKQLDPKSDSFGEVARYLMPVLAERGMMPVAAPAPA